MFIDHNGISSEYAGTHIRFDKEGKPIPNTKKRFYIKPNKPDQSFKFDDDLIADTYQGDGKRWYYPLGKNAQDRVYVTSHRMAKVVDRHSKDWYVDSKGYAVKTVNGVTKKMHNLVREPPPGGVTDHRNSIITDNTPQNLKPTTYSENSANRRTSNKTGFKGVTQRGNKFYAVKTYLGKRQTKGPFDTPEEASPVYLQMSLDVGHEIHASKIKAPPKRLRI